MGLFKTPYFVKSVVFMTKTAIVGASLKMEVAAFPPIYLSNSVCISGGIGKGQFRSIQPQKSLGKMDPPYMLGVYDITFVNPNKW